MIVLCYTWVCARSTETSQEKKQDAIITAFVRRSYNLQKHNHDGRFNQLCYFEITWRSLMHLAYESLTIQLASSYSKINDRFRFSSGLERVN